MAYTKTVWKDQDVENPRTYISRDNGDDTITLLDAFGTVTELGTPVNATNMNKIENGIYDLDQNKANDIDVVHKTGAETIDGIKTFLSHLVVSNIQPTFRFVSTVAEKTVAPAGSRYSYLYFQDMNNKSMGSISHIYNSSMDSILRLSAIKSDVPDYQSLSAYLDLCYPASGNPYATAPASDVNNSIVTTTGINKAQNGYVKLGNGLIIQLMLTEKIQNSGTTITFPTPFPNTNYSIVFNAFSSSPNNENAITVSERTETTCKVYGKTYDGGNLNRKCFMIAIGY